jgi:adenylosuccinate synthase
MKRGKLNIVMGGQAGSESKGKLSAYLASKFHITHFAGCLSPNAGHVVIRDNVKYVTHHIPVGVAGCLDPRQAHIFIGPASVINPDILLSEISMLRDNGIDPYLIFVDGRATVIQPHHINDELSHMTVIGSTAQGVGEARVDKIMRRGLRMADTPFARNTGLVVEGVGNLLIKAMDRGATVLYEMGQGFDLCIDHGVNPIYCTSRNCTPQQALADMGVPNRYLGDIYAVVRTYPIRVNNRDGFSGPYPSPEISWEEIRDRCGADRDITEMTTTTKLRRRVFEFSMDRIKEMVRTCDPSFLCVQFANYLDWGIYGSSSVHDLSTYPLVDKFIQELEVATSTMVGYIGTGPNHIHMIDTCTDELE